MSKNQETLLYEGRLFEVIQVPDPHREGNFFEIARRGPGTRVIFASDTSILLTREFRRELGKYDFRLPGGKVFDSLTEYRQALSKRTDVEALAMEGAAREAVEEVGLQPLNLEFLHLSVCGATVEWDLYYFLCTEWTNVGRDHIDPGEDISVSWYSFEQAREFVLSGEMTEERSALQLIRFLAAR